MPRFETSLPAVHRRARASLAAGCLALAACTPGAPPKEPPRPAPEAEPPVQAELRAAPPPSAAKEAGAAPAATAAPPPAPSGPLECLTPPDPELNKESSWSQETGQRLERLLPSLRRCSADLPAEEEAIVTLRMVYAKNGVPLSQHVVTSTQSACAVTECLKRELSQVRSPELLIDKASIDLTLKLTPGGAPERLPGPVDPLTPEEAPVSAEDGCVDPAVAQLSQSRVREVVATAYPALLGCYTQALTRDHHATGKVMFEFVIGQGGAVSDAWARDATLYDCEAIRCMLQQFQALRFPEPVGRSVRVIYPISYVLEQTPMTLRP